MRSSDIEHIQKVIRASGIGTRIQRDAICQRIDDWFNNFRDEKYTREQPHDSGPDIRTPSGEKS